MSRVDLRAGRGTETDEAASRAAVGVRAGRMQAAAAVQAAAWAVCSAVSHPVHREAFVGDDETCGEVGGGCACVIEEVAGGRAQAEPVGRSVRAPTGRSDTGLSQLSAPGAARAEH